MNSDDQILSNVSTKTISKIIVRDAQSNLFSEVKHGLRYWIDMLNSYIDPTDANELSEFCFNGHFVKDSSIETEYDVISYVEMSESGASAGEWCHESYSLFGTERRRTPWDEMEVAEDCNCVFITKEQANEILKTLGMLIDATSI